MEIIIWIIIGIIYAIASANGRTGSMWSNRRKNGYGKYGLYGMQDDFSLEIDPLEGIRETYENRLKNFYQNNAPRTYLINEFCEARLVKEPDGNTWFYVKERALSTLSDGQYFEVSGNTIHAYSMWGIMDMTFSNQTRFNNIKELYYKLNQARGTIGGLKYFHQSAKQTLPKSITNKMTQNEFCRMEIETLSSGEKVLICSEIWGTPIWDKPLKFMIKADKLVLYGFLSELDALKRYDYQSLLYYFKGKENCTVTELNNTGESIASSEETYSAQKEPEPIKDVQVDLTEKQQKDNKKDTNNLPKKEIKKYNERNIDL